MMNRFFNLLILSYLFLSITACTRLPNTDTVPPISPVSTKPAYLGVAYEPVQGIRQTIPDAPANNGLQITGILPNSPAEKSGLRLRDIILQFDQQILDNLPATELAQAFSTYIDQHKHAGDMLNLRILRMETLINGQRNQEPIALPNRNALDELMRSQKIGETLHIEIKEQWQALDLVATLATRQEQPSVTLPSNAELFPEYQSINTVYDLLIQQLFNDDNNLNMAYQDLLKRYAEDEYWDDGLRLRYIRYLHRDPLKMPVIVEKVTDTLLTQAMAYDTQALIQQGTDLLDITAKLASDLPHAPTTLDPQVHLIYLQKILYHATQYQRQAFQALNAEERQFIQETIPQLLEYYTTFNAPEAVQAQFPQLFALAHKIDFSALFQAALTLNQLADPTWRDTARRAFQQLSINPTLQHPNVTGGLLAIADSVAGKIIIGSDEINRYNANIALIFDIGGNDFYIGETGLSDWQRPTVMIDMAGNDEYTATRLGGQGAGIFGVALLLDTAGNDHYQGVQFVQGAGLMGIGLLYDLAGDDEYTAHTYAQGIGLWGYGLLLDTQGNDHYRATLYGQGVGSAKGLGLLLDSQGDDTYLALGAYESTYGTLGIFHGSSQGSGFGFRNNTSGGIGILLDGQGKDQFKAGNFSQGGGYFFALGILRNAGNGDDNYIGSRYGQGFSAHSALGILIDDGGDDHYQGYQGALQSAAWDLGTAMLIDKGGDDIYDSRDLFFSIAAAAHNGFSLFIDHSGRDQYFYSAEPRVGKNDYHGGLSLSLWIDAGGAQDFYNNSVEANNRTHATGGEFGVLKDF
ncbi:hypothetical protein BegalDRAFT_2517 [Beggiatoa alba B18LD]|uniref:PDZ domain-containing protein n=1 Tax=Beggiatoa alba B18LD TaxID=395493 RepID=I3CIB7_9GAMM|nr:PDZ domain-containing protein [Beggiatoa alba]EIJ43360.1 hypothetical protein BegalDRAFT_2517 [Beggiatoa alba B18LD]